MILIITENIEIILIHKVIHLLKTILTTLEIDLRDRGEILRQFLYQMKIIKLSVPQIIV